MSPLRMAAAMALGALTACASNPPPRPTRVDREQRVVADNEARTQWFATLYSLQRQLATADARRIEAVAPLQVLLCLSADASLARLAAVAQARMTVGGVPRTTTRLRRTVDSEQALARWISATTVATGDLVEREALIAVEETLVIERRTPTGLQPVPLGAAGAPVAEPRCEPGATDGTQGGDPAAVPMQLASVLRRSAAQALMFQRTVALAGELRGQFAALSTGATGALREEFRAADRALFGVAARATMHLHESARTQQWAQALLTPEGETPPEEVPDVQPEDNNIEGRAPDADPTDHTMPVRPAAPPDPSAPGTPSTSTSPAP